MSDHVTIEFDAYPWQPSASARLVEELDHWNRPTAGILEENGQLFLFRVLENIDAGQDIWIFAPLSSEDVAAMQEAATRTELSAAMKRACEARPLIAVGTAPDSRVKVAAMVDPVTDAEPNALLLAAAQDLQRRLGPLIRDVSRDGDLASEFMEELTRLA